MAVRTRLYPQAVASISARVTDPGAAKAATAIATRTRRNIAQLGRIDSGQMYSGITTQRSPRSRQDRAIWQVRGTAPHTKFQEFGTRAHGPVRARFLRFKPKGAAGYVFAKWVRGVTAGRFMRRALDSTSISDFV